MENDTLSTTDGAQRAVEDAAVKPVVSDVILVNKDQLAGSLTISRYATTRRQRTLRGRMEPGRPSDDSCLTEMPSARPSSTFKDISQSVLFYSFLLLLLLLGRIAALARCGL